MNPIIIILISVIHPFMGNVSAQHLTKETLSLESKILDAKKDFLIGKYNKSIEKLEPLYGQNRDNLTLSFELAKNYVSIQGYDKAIKYTKNALRIDPNNEWVNLFYGNIMMDQKRYDEAVLTFEKLCSLHPTRTDYYDMLISAAEANQDWLKANLAFDLLTENLGVNKYTLNRKYQFYEKHGDTTKAIETLSTLVNMYPKDVRYLKLLALNFQSAGNEAEAEKLFTKVLKIDPNDSEANLALLKDIDDPNTQNNYLRALRPIIENDQIDVDAKVQELIPYTLQYQNSPHDKELESSLLFLGEKMALTHPENSKALAIYSDILFLAGNYENAALQYKKTLKLNKNIYQVWLQYFNTLNILKDYTNLLQVAKNSIDYFPNQPLPYAYLGLALIQNDNLEKGMAELEEAKFIAGDNALALSDIETILGIYYFKQNSRATANDHFNSAIKYFPSNTFTLRTLGEIAEDNESKNKYYREAFKYGDKSIQILEFLNQ